MRIEVVQRPAPEAPVTWTREQRAAALEATFALARARIARGDGARDEALRAYADGAQGLAPFDAPVPLLALRRTLEEERVELERTPDAGGGAVGGPEERLVFYDVQDLAAAMPGLGFPTVEIVGPEGTRVEPPAAALGGQLYALLPAGHGPITPNHLRELRTKNGVLILRAGAARHAAMRRYLDTLRGSWPRLWPEAFVSQAPVASTSSSTLPAGLVVEIHQVADLAAALERLGDRVEVGDPDDAPLERLLSAVRTRLAATQVAGVDAGRVDALTSGGSTVVVKATRAQQGAVGELLAGWRDGWLKRWPAAFVPAPGGG
jgi:hypothetical protein